MPENIDDKCYDDCPHAIWDYLCCKHSNTKCDCGGQRGIEWCELELDPEKCTRCDQCGKYFEPVAHHIQAGLMKGSIEAATDLLEKAVKGKSLMSLFDQTETTIQTLRETIIEAEGHDCKVG